MECEKCKNRDGLPYKYYFGKKKAEVNTLTKTVTNYDIGGSKEVILCHNCISLYRLLRLAKTIGFMLFGALLVLLGGPLLTFKGTEKVTIFQVVGMVMVLMGFLYLLVVVIGFSKKRMGEELAVLLNKSDHKSKGFNAFWTDEEYSKMEQSN